MKIRQRRDPVRPGLGAQGVSPAVAAADSDGTFTVARIQNRGRLPVEIEDLELLETDLRLDPFDRHIDEVLLPLLGPDGLELDARRVDDSAERIGTGRGVRGSLVFAPGFLWFTTTQVIDDAPPGDG
jgi:hypothetical protein